MSTIAESTTHIPGAAVGPLEPGSPVVEISLLGGFRLVVGGRDVTPNLRRRDARRLAEYLAMASGRRVHRERLVDALWPDAPFDSVQNRLHKAAHFLRRATGVTDAVVLSGDIVSLLPHARVETDVFVFERLAHEGLANRDRTAIDRAIALYGGDLLPDDPYTEWVEYDRHRLRSRLRELLRISGGFDRLVAVDPTDEHAHLGLMRAMLHAGDRAGVLHQYALLTRVLDRELGIEPGSEARALRGLALSRATVSGRRPAPLDRNAHPNRSTPEHVRPRTGSTRPAADRALVRR